MYSVSDDAWCILAVPWVISSDILCGILGWYPGCVLGCILGVILGGILESFLGGILDSILGGILCA